MRPNPPAYSNSLCSIVMSIGIYEYRDGCGCALIILLNAFTLFLIGAASESEHLSVSINLCFMIDLIEQMLLIFAATSFFNFDLISPNLYCFHAMTDLCRIQ